MNSRFTVTLLVLLQLLPLLLFGVDENIISIRGRVSDSNSGRAMAFATIALKGSSVAIVANNEGIFTLKLPKKNINDTIVVSFLGYKSNYIPISALYGNLNQIELSPTSLLLDPALVIPQEPLAIIKMALSKIKENYGGEWLQMSSFYRETVQKKERYISINEALLSINKAPYNTFRNDRVALYKGRGNHSASRSDTIIVKLQGGPLSALQIDVVKEPFLWVDSREIEFFYQFSMGEPATIDDKLFYRIDFLPLPHIKEILFKGTLFIDPHSFAIGRIQFSMNVERRKDATNIFIVKSPPGVKFEILGANYVVNYRKSNLEQYRADREHNYGNWHFDYSKSELQFSVKWPKRWFSSSYTIKTEMAVTDLSKTLNPIASSQTIKAKDIISYRVEDYLDPNFWGNYNSIEPEAPIERIIEKIAKSLRK